MWIPSFPGFLGAIFQFQVDSRISKSLDYHDIVKYAIFNTSENMCNFHISNLISLVKIAQVTWFFYSLTILKIKKSCRGQNFFSNLAIFWVKKRQNQEFGLHKILLFLIAVTRPKISKSYWSLKPKLKFESLFRWNMNIWIGKVTNDFLKLFFYFSNFALQKWKK